MWTVASDVVRQCRLGTRWYPLMLEPLVRDTLAGAGCGRIHDPPHVLKRQHSIETVSRWWTSKDHAAAREPVLPREASQPDPGR